MTIWRLLELFLCTLLVLATSMQPTNGFSWVRTWKTSSHLNVHTKIRQAIKIQSLRDDDVSLQACLSSSPRRKFFQQSGAFLLSLLSWSSFNQITQAADVRGPVELLRPATRVRLYIDHAVRLCTEIQNSNNVSVSSLDPLSDFFDHEPPSFMTPDESKLSRRYLEIDTSSGWQSARLKEREARAAEIGIDYTTPYDRFNTAIQQWGDTTQFRILRSRQRKLEKSNSLRAAFNAYTNNLVFGNAYRLNVQGDEKKYLVRSNALPDVNAVVVSDLDLRDLYRNQILENLDNAKAEIAYQRTTGHVEAGDILAYLLAAQEATDAWFGFIPKEDTEVAQKDVMTENAIRL